MDPLELAAADVFERENPEFARLVRQAKAMGAPKSELVRRVTQQAAGSQFVRCGLLILVDRIWNED